MDKLGRWLGWCWTSLSILYIVICYYDMCFWGCTRARLEWETEDKSVGPATTTARYLLYEMAPNRAGHSSHIYSPRRVCVCCKSIKCQDAHHRKSCLADWFQASKTSTSFFVVVGFWPSSACCFTLHRHSAAVLIIMDFFLFLCVVVVVEQQRMRHSVLPARLYNIHRAVGTMRSC